MARARATGLATIVLLGCSSSDDGSTGGRDGGVTGPGGAKGQGGTPAGSGDAAPTLCEATNPFSGPELRGCDLPGACGLCLREKACPQFLFQCAHDPDCVCMAECVGTAGVAGTRSCLAQCGLTTSPPGFVEWVKLAADMCWDEGCGRLTEPPPETSLPGGTIGAGTDESCAFDTSLSYDPCGPVLQLENADRSICMRVDRRNDGAGNDANSAWTLLGVRVGPRGEVCHTEDPGDLCWYSSHHNFSDWAHVSCGNRHYSLNVAYNCGLHNSSPSPTFRLHTFESVPQGGACAPTATGTCPIGTPIDLVPVP